MRHPAPRGPVRPLLYRASHRGVAAWGRQRCLALRARVNRLGRRPWHARSTDLARPLAKRIPSCRTGVRCAIGLSSVRPERCPMEAFIVSTAVVAVAEIGDKTQLLALVLA